MLEFAIWVWTIPAPVVQIHIAIPATGASGAKLTEMPRHADLGLCCGAGGARMWMEEHIGKRVNHERVDEALATDATKDRHRPPVLPVMRYARFCRSRGTPGRAR